ncbi:hypothetical protein BTW08_13795 [Salinicola sp. MH3R3-1]|nr:hypothetical protein BTW08_13795 [Salinicola sp. MH3R3-1]
MGRLGHDRLSRIAVVFIERAFIKRQRSALVGALIGVVIDLMIYAWVHDSIDGAIDARMDDALGGSFSL